LARQVGGEAKPVPAGNGDRPAESPAPAAPKSNGNGTAGPTQFWKAVNDLGVERAKAHQIARGAGSWAEKLAALSS